VMLAPVPAPPKKITPTGVRVAWNAISGTPAKYKVTWEEADNGGWAPKGIAEDIEDTFFDIPGLSANKNFRWRVETAPDNPNVTPPAPTEWEEFTTADIRLKQFIGGTWTPRVLHINVNGQWRTGPLYKHDGMDWVPL
jgi:hypothetical protein